MYPYPESSRSSCCTTAYPIALSAQTLAGIAVSSTVSNILNGSGSGNFGWLTWTGDTSEGTLVASLTPPGNSGTYINPATTSDHALVAGKSVSGRPGVSNSSAVRAALDTLKTRDIIVPVWDTASGGGSGAAYHVSAFARVRLLDYRLPGNKDYISVRFLGYAACGAAGASASPSPSPTPTGTPVPLSTTRVITYSYDGLQRLTDAVENPGTAYHYAYDAAGNRTTVAVNGVPDARYAYDAANQVIGWGYDAAGNVISDTSRLYSYDALNRLTGLTEGPEQRAYAYNGDGVLISQTVNGATTQFAQDLAADESQVLQAQTAGGTTDYLYGQDRLAALNGGTRSWYGTDGQSSVRYTLDDQGNTSGPRNYDPYGTPEGTQMPDLFGYTGELQDAATGAEYLRARWYNPASGQFFSRDPLTDMTEQPYSYAADNPANGADPSGNCTIREGRQTVTLSGLGGAGRCDEQYLAQLRTLPGPVGNAVRHHVRGSSLAINAALDALVCDARDPLTYARLAAGGTIAQPVAVLNPGQTLTAADGPAAVAAAEELISGLTAGEAAAGGAAVLEGAGVALGGTIAIGALSISVPVLLVGLAIAAVVVGGVLLFVAVANPPRVATPPQTQPQPGPTPTPGPRPQPSPGPGPVPPVPVPVPTPSQHQYLYHYTFAGNIPGIVSLGLRPSLSGGPDAQWGDGQYFTDLTPQESGTVSRQQHLYALFNVPWKWGGSPPLKPVGWIKVDVRGLPVIRVAPLFGSRFPNRSIYLHPSTANLILPNLILQGRIADSGIVTFQPGPSGNR